YLTQAEADALVFPDTVKKRSASATTGFGRETPAGLVIPHVLDELTHSENTVFSGMKWQAIMDGGYRIVTTIDKKAQDVAIKAADETVKGSVMYGQPKNLQAALTAIEPNTGRVLAYYGGHDGQSADYAGIYRHDEGVANGFGAHPPGSSFKVYTLAAA